MSRVYTAESPIHGTGVFSSARLSPGYVVLRIDDSRVVTDAEPLDPARGEFEHHCDYLADGVVVLMRRPERSINHRCDPNTYIRTIAGDRYVVALREIAPGEEITYDYCINGEGDTQWECACGSPACRKLLLSGFFYLPVEVQARYLALLEDWFVAEHREEVDALKLWVEATRKLEPSRDEPSTSGAGVVASEVEGHDPSGIVLVVNPVLSAEEATSLFLSAWGAEAPDSPRPSIVAWRPSGPTTAGGWSASSSSPGTAATTSLSWTPPSIPSTSGVGSGGSWSAGPQGSPRRTTSSGCTSITSRTWRASMPGAASARPRRA